MEDLVKLPKKRRGGRKIDYVDVGRTMVEVGKRHTGLDVKEETILDLPESTLKSVRELAFEEILRAWGKSDADVYIVLTHALFHWKGALIPGWSPMKVVEMKPDYFLTLWEDASIVWKRLNDDPRWAGIALSEVVIWREEENFVTAMMAEVVGKPQFLVAREHPVETLCDLICWDRKKVYRSYPITEVMPYPQIQSEVDEFRDEMEKAFVVFDPGTAKDAEFAFWLEKCLEQFEATINSKRASAKERLDAACDGLTPDEKKELVESIELTVGEKKTVIEQVCQEILSDADQEKDRAGIQERLAILGEVALKLSPRGIKDVVLQLDQQTVANDYKLVRQSDAVVAYWPALPNGGAPLSFGVICEMFYGLTSQKEVCALWLPVKRPSPFLQSISTHCFEGPESARKFFDFQGVTKTIYHQKKAGNT